MSLISDRLDGIQAGVAIKAPCRVSTTANITLSGEQTIDGVAVSANGSGTAPDRVLVKNQTNTVENGIYDVSTSGWTRAKDFDGARDVVQGTLVPVYAGTVNGRTTWQCTTANPVRPGTSSITFEVVVDVDLAADLASSTDGLGVSLVYGASRVVNSIAALKALSKTYNSRVFVTGYYAVGDGGGGHYWYDSTDTTTADNGGTVIVAADGGRWKLIITSGFISVKQFGAKGDGVADDSTAINACIDVYTLIGGKIFFPHGNYLCASAVAIDRTAVTSESALTRLTLEGEGSGSTQLRFTSTDNGIIYSGGTTGGGSSSYLKISGLRLQGTGAGTCDGLALSFCAFAHFEDLIVTGFTTGRGIYGADVLSCLFDACQIRANKYGILMEIGTSSTPNAMTFVGTDIGLNTEYGAYLKQATTLSMTGGSVQGNGLGGVAATRWGIKIDNGGGGGATSISLDGVYFEYNSITADLWIDHVSNDCTYNVNGCTFNRIDNVTYVTNNIRMDVGGGKALLVTTGCGFKGFNTYSPDAARRYIAVNVSGGSSNFFDHGNFYASSTETPDVAGPIRNTLTQCSAFIRFNGTAGSASQAVNATLTKNGTGDYTITYDRAMSTATNCYSYSLSAAGTLEVTGESTTDVDIITRNLAGAATDFSIICLTVFGGADYV